MTREDAKNILSDIKAYLTRNPQGMVAGYRHIDVCDAIKVLEQEPCEDVISRQQCIDAVNKILAQYTPKVSELRKLNQNLREKESGK